MKTITRREFLLAGAGLTIAVSFSPLGSRLLSASEMEKEKTLFSPDVWLEITPENIVNIVVNKSEMGQGVYTSLPMVLADELEADWKQVRLKVAPARDEYKDPIRRVQATGGSTSVRNMYEPLRKAGAAAREMLVRAAAENWKVPASECEAFQGRVRHIVSNRSISFGELSIRAASLQVPKSPVLKRENQFRFIGSPVLRLDVQDKVNGRAKFGIDSFVDNMVYAAIARPTAYGAKALSFDKNAAMKIKGVTDIIPIHSGIAVCAETPDAAWRTKEALNVVWDKGSDPDLNSESLEKAFIRDLDKGGISARDDGDARAVLDKAVKKLSATYILPYLSHATMEPMNCTASVTRERCDIWVPTQSQTEAWKVAAQESGLKQEQVHVHTTYLGGGFGRRAETDVVLEAVRISKASGKPVKLIWKREEDLQNDFYRPANCSRIEGGLDAKGRLIAWSHKIVCPSIFSRRAPDRLKDGIDPAAVEGLRNMEYEVPNVSVEYVKIDTPVPVGFWRSVGSSHNAFTVESFVDEMADLAGKDPLEFRLGLLKNHRRAHRVLEIAAEKAGWGKPPASGIGRGIAQHMSFGSYVAQIAEVSVNKKDGGIRVHRVVCAVDCGPAVNPAIITAQMESGIIMGLSAALKEKIEFKKGGVETSNYDNYDLLRISEIPEIEVYIVRSNDPLGGIGEPGVPPIAPAVANAVFNASGIRLRRLPMKSETVMDVMKKT